MADAWEYAPNSFLNWQILRVTNGGRTVGKLSMPKNPEKQGGKFKILCR